MPINRIYKKDNIEIAGDSTLWRYIDFPKYASLLLRERLFFCRVNKMSDPYEGMITRRDYEYLKKQYAGDSENMEVIERWKAKARESYFANCWHMAEYESVAMWSIYGVRGQSIAITSTFSDLVSALPYFVSVGLVDYIHFEKDSHYFKHNLGEDMLVMSKRQSFEYEKEVRFFVKEIKGFTRDLYEPCPDGNGVYVPVNVNRIVKGVYIDPAAPSWVTALVTDFSQKNRAAVLRIILFQLLALISNIVTQPWRHTVWTVFAIPQCINSNHSVPSAGTVR